MQSNCRIMVPRFYTFEGLGQNTLIGFFLMKKAGLVSFKIKVRLQIVKKKSRAKRLK